MKHTSDHLSITKALRMDLNVLFRELKKKYTSYKTRHQGTTRLSWFFTLSKLSSEVIISDLCFNILANDVIQCFNKRQITETETKNQSN